MNAAKQKETWLYEYSQAVETTLRWVQQELEEDPREARQCIPGIAAVLP